MPLKQIAPIHVRRLAITAQYLNQQTPPPIQDLIHEIGCIQLDPINAVERSHLLVMWSRYDQMDEAALNRQLWETKSLFEYWAHAASIVSTADYPIHHWNMRQTAAKDDQWHSQLQEKGLDGLEEYVLNHLRKQGASLSRDIEDPSDRFHSVWWSGRHVPRILDHLWTRGDVMVVGRQGRQRVWGLTENFLPAAVRNHERLDDMTVTRKSIERAVRALGVATPKQINYHFTRGRYPELKTALEQLIDEGILEEVEIIKNGESLSGRWYLHVADTDRLSAIMSQQYDWDDKHISLLSPFDNLICDRDRTEALFDFRFRIEIYVPKDKREYGYYVLPILHGDRLIGRIHPKYDRKTKTLHIYNVYREPDAPRNKPMLLRIRRAIESLAATLGATQIEWGDIPDSWSALR